MKQELFENLSVFLEKKRGCSNVESEVPIAGQTDRLEWEQFGRVDVVGGKFYKSEHYREKDRAYSCIELHCIEYKSEQDDVTKGIGQLFWYKFGMSETHLWVERLFLYLLIDEHRIFEDLKKFCKAFGFGLLQVNPAEIISEVVSPENQHDFVAKVAQDKTTLKCPQPSCGKTFSPKDLKCPECGAKLEPEAPLFWELFADGKFRFASGNPEFRGAPSSMPKRVKQTPLLKKVFQNWSKVGEAWEKENVRDI